VFFDHVFDATLFLSLFQILAHNAVHAAFAGYTGVTVGLVREREKRGSGGGGEEEVRGDDYKTLFNHPLSPPGLFLGEHPLRDAAHRDDHPGAPSSGPPWQAVEQAARFDRATEFRGRQLRRAVSVNDEGGEIVSSFSLIARFV
jgi:hypothetical protein